METKVVKYNSLEEFISWVDTCPKHELDYGRWTGARSYPEATGIAREGIDLGRVESQLKSMEHSRNEMVMVMDVSGSTVNMDAYMSGVPENMMDFPIVAEPTKFLNLFLDITEHANVPAEYMVNKAIAIASIVDDLENNGYRVAITIGNVISLDKSFTTGKWEPVILTTMIRIKEYHSAISIGQLTGCCHPSFLRVLWFAHCYGTYKSVGGPPEGLGRSASTGTVLDVLEANADKGTVYIPNSRNGGLDLSTVESAVEGIKRHIN